MTKNVLLIGASGLTGSFLLKELLADETFAAVTSLVRRPSGEQHPKLIETILNFDYWEGLQTSLPTDASFDTAFCCLGTTMKKAGTKEAFYKVDFTYVEKFAQVALSQGVKHFLLVSAMGAAANSGIFYNQVKGKIEESVSQMGFEQVSILRPSLLLGPRKEKRLGENIGKIISNVLDPLIPAKFKGIAAATVADAMVKLAKVPKHGKNIYLSDKIKEVAAS